MGGGTGLSKEDLNKEIRKYLERKKETVYKKWLAKFWKSFGKESERVFKKEAEQFENPFGYRIEESFKGLIEVLFGDFNWEKADFYLDRLIQLRAIQENKPSKGLNLFFALKEVVREEFGEDFIERFGIFEYIRFEDKIDVLLVKAMDFYLKYREKLYELRYNEWKRNNFLLLKKAGLVYNPLEGSPLVDEKFKN